MTSYPFTFAGADFVALRSGALFWPAHSALIAADLHLGKSERMARRGGAMLPPFETQDTLQRLQAVIDATSARRLFLLGDLFDDNLARDALTKSDHALWQQIIAETECCVLAGNHDPNNLTETNVDGIALRHIAANGPDISGHYHPKARLKNTTRPAFLIGQEHLILPAFGTYTGGLSVTDPVLTALVDHGLIVMIGSNLLAFPFNGGTG